MFRLSNIRIGIKLMIISGVSILLVAGMIVSQISGDAAIKTANTAADAQSYIEVRLLDAKSSINGMQTGVRDIRLASSATNLQASMKYLEGHHQTARAALNVAISKAVLPENRERMERVRSLIDQYLAGAKEIVSIRNEAIQLANGADAGAGARVAALNEQAARIAREKTLPIAAELEGLVAKAAATAEEAAHKQQAIAEQAMSSAEHLNIAVGAVAILVLIGAAAFGTDRKSVV